MKEKRAEFNEDSIHMPLNDLNISGKKPILIAGPTASGKSGLALALAEQFRGTIVNADALQVYRCWDLLSARPQPADLNVAPHKLYGHIPFDRPYSVGDWLGEIAQCLQDPADGPLIIVGGTGLYFRALTEGLAEIPEIDADIRTKAMSKDVDDMIGDLDPATKSRIDLQNPRRVMRAWEVQAGTGKGLAYWHDATPAPLIPIESADAIVLEAEVDWLNARISRRFEGMVGLGALEEAKAMLPNWDPALPSSQAIGAPELIAHLQGHVSLEAAKEAAIISTRQYAKRQRTWFRARMKSWQGVDASRL